MRRFRQISQLVQTRPNVYRVLAQQMKWRDVQHEKAHAAVNIRKAVPALSKFSGVMMK